MVGVGRLTLTIVVVVGLVGCTLAAPFPPREQTLRLAHLVPLPERPSASPVPVRVAVAAVMSPRGTEETYRPLVSYLSRRLGRPVELVQRRTYAETNALIEQQVVDMAFVCTSAYIEGRATFGLELLVAPQIRGAIEYRSYLIVPTASTATSLSDLRGKVFAFTDPMSLTGRVYPSYLVEQLGSTPAQFFAWTFFTHGHDHAVRAVIGGYADGAAVDSVVFEEMLARDPGLASRVRVIDRSPPFGMPPVVVSPATRPQVRAVLKELLLGLPTDPSGEGPEVLTALGIDRFVEISDEHYESARTIVRNVASGGP